jgi:phosphate acetyltransferase
MRFIEDLKARAKRNKKKIVLPEGTDERIIDAARCVVTEGVADVILLGTPEEVREVIQKRGLSPDTVQIINPLNSSDVQSYAEEFFRLRKHKGISFDDAVQTLKDYVYFAAMMVHMGDADGFVGGAVHTTRNVVRAAIHCIGMAENISTASSSFIMVLNNNKFGHNGILVFADCGIVRQPTPRQLADIAISTAELTRTVVGCIPRVAMLSYSTKGSASGEPVEKVVEATKLLKESAPGIVADGELQSDAAIVYEVAKRKAPESLIHGDANVLIFPDLNSGNISYKLVQRLAGAVAIGPLVQGLAKPCSDLSRGCTVSDIIGAITVTAVR